MTAAKRKSRASVQLALTEHARDKAVRELEVAQAQLRAANQVVSGLTAEVSKLKNAIKKHRDHAAGHWCRPCDTELYVLLGEPVVLQPIPTGPEGRRAYLFACDQYWHRVTGTPHATATAPMFHRTIERVLDALWTIYRAAESCEDPRMLQVCMYAVAGQAMRLSECAVDLRRVETQEKERTRPLDDGPAIVGYTEE